MLFSIDGSEVLAYGPTAYEPTFAQPAEAEATDSGAPFDAAWFAAGLAGENGFWDGSDSGYSGPWLAAGPAGDDGHPEHITLASDAQLAARQPITSTDWPWSAIVKLTVSFPSGDLFDGSGVMVGRNDVLTAAHLVYKRSEGGYANSVIVTPAFEPERGYESRYGSFHARVQIADTNYDHDANGVFFPAGMILPGNNGPGLVGSERDVALLALQTPLGDRTGWMAVDPDFKEGWANLSGYSNGGRLTNDTEWAQDAVSDSYTSIRNFEADHGTSGGPVWHYDSLGRPAVVAIVSSGSNGHGRAAFDVATSWASIRQWIQANNHLIT